MGLGVGGTWVGIGGGGVKVAAVGGCYCLTDWAAVCAVYRLRLT